MERTVASEGQQRKARGLADIGVLFVHGMGQQPRGDTLIRFGRPIISWLEQRMGKENISLAEAVLEPTDEDSDAPAHTEIQLRIDAASQKDPRTWVLAESWWAKSFLSPDMWDVVRWILVRVPWTILIQFGARTRRVRKLFRYARLTPRAARGPTVNLILKEMYSSYLQFPFALGFVFLFECLLILLVLLAFLPVARLRSFVRTVQQGLADRIGDSFIFLDSPIQAASMSSQVERDINWLMERCKTVCIVAHSQGAAVAHLALHRLRKKGSWPAKLSLFVTFGSGIRKLKWLRLASEEPILWNWLAFSALISAVVFWGSLGVLFALELVSAPPWEVVAVLVSVSFCGLIGLFSTWAKASRVLMEFPEPKTPNPIMEWIDFYASRDMTPGGPMLDDQDPWRTCAQTLAEALAAATKQPPLGKPPTRSIKVHNLSSILKDHTAYWFNTDQFVSSVTWWIAHHARMAHGLLLPDIASLNLAELRRVWRVRFLTQMRWIASVSAIVMVVGIRKRLGAIGLEIAGKTAAAFNLLVPAVKRYFVSNYPTIPLPYEALGRVLSTILGAVALLLGVLVIYHFACLGWRAWERAELKSFFSTSEYHLRSPSFGLFCFSTIILAEISLLFLLPEASELGVKWLWFLVPPIPTTFLLARTARDAPRKENIDKKSKYWKQKVSRKVSLLTEQVEEMESVVHPTRH